MRPIALDDNLSRFVLSSSQFASTTGRVRASLFLPAPDGTTSVFVTTGLNGVAVCQIGRDEVATPHGKTLHGRADLGVSVIENARLVVQSDEPPDRHAIITRWPAEKDACKDLAQQIAERSRFTACPPSAAR
jgi:hypothetical protein